jgi:hypothetical protein
MRRLLLLPAILVTLLLAPAGPAAAAEEELGTLLASSTFAGSLTAGPDGNVWFSAANLEGEGGPVVGKVTPAGELTRTATSGSPNRRASRGSRRTARSPRFRSRRVREARRR